MNERTIFLEALEKDNPEQRSAFLDEVCGGDAELRQRVDTLLSAHNDAGSFLEKTPQEIDADSVFGQTVDQTPGRGEGPATDALTADEAWQSLLTPCENSDRLGTLGPYEIVELVGRGGMGVVLRAHEPKLSRTIAVKLLAPELALNATAVQRFLREARAAAAVSHDHVVAIHSIDDESHPPVIVMEFIQGQSLQQKIDKVGALDVKSILRIGMQTAAGLSAAHRQGLVHRDIKPANILLENGIERVKLTDFGLARAVDDISMTRTGQITGTPQYMSPEQAQGQRVDHRTDLFSLGCVLYAMCTGRAAFRADSAVAVMHRVVHGTPRPIREVNEDIPDWLCEIVDKLLAKEVDDRFASAEEVEDLLSRHLAHLQQPTSVPQPERIVGTKNGSSVPASAVMPEHVHPESLRRQTTVPRWLLWKFPAWTPLALIVVLFAVRMLADYGPQSLPGFPELAIIFTFVVALPLAVAMLISKWLRHRFGNEDDRRGLGLHPGFWFILFAVVPVGAAAISQDLFRLHGPTAMAAAMLLAMLGASFLLKTRKSMGHLPEAANTADRPSDPLIEEDKPSRLVDISEDFEKDLQRVGGTLMFVCFAAMMAPLGTYIISDQVEIPFVESILGFFLLTSLLVFPIAMRATLDLFWLPITRRRPGAVVLLATALAVVPWNPLLLLLLPWTILAFRRVRRPDVLELIGVTENDPRAKSVLGTGLDLLKKPAFVIVSLLMIVVIVSESSGVTDFGVRVKGMAQGTGTISFEGLKPGGSVLGPGNATTTADVSDGHYEATLPAGQFEIVSVTDRSFVKRIPLTVDAGNCGSVIVDKDAQGLIIREVSRARRNYGVISVTTRGDVICEGGEIYLAVTGRWVIFVPPGKYRVTTILKDGSFSKTTSDVTPSTFLGLLRKADDVAEVKIAAVDPSSSDRESAERSHSPFFTAFTEFVSDPASRSETWKLATPYIAGESIARQGTSDDGSEFVAWEIKSAISGTSNSLRTSLPAFRDYIEEVAKENGARITKTTPTDGEHRAVANMVMEFETAETRGTIRMEMAGFADEDLHGLQSLNCGLRFEIQEWSSP